MCLGLVGRIVELRADVLDIAIVDIAGVRRPINLGLLDEGDRPALGGWVLVHMGFALESLSETEAAEALATLDTFGAERRADAGQPQPEPTTAEAS